MGPDILVVLVRAIADIALFLEFTDASQLDEDAAIGALEQLAATLQDLPAPDREAVSSVFHVVAKSYPDSISAMHVAGLPEALGLTQLSVVEAALRDL